MARGGGAGGGGGAGDGAAGRVARPGRDPIYLRGSLNLQRAAAPAGRQAAPAILLLPHSKPFRTPSRRPPNPPNHRRTAQFELLEGTYERRVNRLASPSYPGLATQYTTHRVAARLPALPAGPFSTREARAGGALTTWWEWGAGGEGG